MGEGFLVERQAAIKHIEYCIKMMNKQMACGRYFVFEHPAYATTWELEVMEKFRLLPGVMMRQADMCMYGLTTPSWDRKSEMPAKKPTTFLSNSWCILEELSTVCDKTHEHQPLMGGRASKAQEYTNELCHAICRGLANQKRYDRSGKVCSGIVAAETLKSMISLIAQRPEGGGEYPSHWKDEKHEADGTAHNFLEGAANENVEEH